MVSLVSIYTIDMVSLVSIYTIDMVSFVSIYTIDMVSFVSIYNRHDISCGYCLLLYNSFIRGVIRKQMNS